MKANKYGLCAISLSLCWCLILPTGAQAHHHATPQPPSVPAAQLAQWAPQATPRVSPTREAIWWDRNAILLPPRETPQQQLTLVFEDPQGHRESYTLMRAGSFSQVFKTQVPGPYAHYQVYRLLKTPELTRPEWLAEHLQQAVTLHTAQGPTGLQIAPVIDRYFTTQQPLGVEYITEGQSQRPRLRVWAPTARAVRVMVKDAQGNVPAQATHVVTHPLQSRAHGVWEITGPAHWNRAYYQIEVDVYQPLSQSFVTYRLSDPYAVSLNTQGTWSQFVNLDDADLFPLGWDTPVQPPPAPEDWVLYELHLRDFSQKDPQVLAKHRGKYTAFAQKGLGHQHLKALAESGLTHVHLLPSFDIATIPEDQNITPDLSAFEANAKAERPLTHSELPQSIIGKTRTQDAFNWGYDPLHYGVPEGSYSTNPEGSTRIREFREMVQALHQLKLGVVMDVVYNHTHATGEAPQSILDKLVPGYYYRLDAKGQPQHSSCCPDTASEHQMMEHLMVQTLVRWAKAYHVSGFRFDLMGHHTRSNLRHIREALDRLTLAKDGIDGKSIFLYGEGWKFGSLQAIAPDEAMHQVNTSGTGIGTFNDRMRDSLRGGNFDHATRSDQGFINGLSLNPNHSPWNTDTPKGAAAQARQLEQYTQLIRLSMAGNLKNYRLQGTAGKDWAYRGATPAGYTADPQENINYVSAHDNYSLWDQIAAKAPVNTPAETRARMQFLGLSAVLLGQGVPFLHAGSEILRSKSGDGDSYDSGDWFNALDWSLKDNNWGKGLPPAWRNEQEWDFWKPLLTQPQFRPTQALTQWHLEQVKNLLRTRRDTPLLRLHTAEAIQKQVRFLNAEAGEKAIPGLIAMHIEDVAHQDPQRQRVLVLLNANPEPISFTHPLLENNTWQPFRLKTGTQPFPGVKGQVPAYSIAVLESPWAILD